MLRSIMLLTAIGGLLLGCSKEKPDSATSPSLQTSRETDPPSRSSNSPANADLLRTAFDEPQPTPDVTRPESLKATYVNHFRVHSSPIEFIFDLGAVSQGGDDQAGRFEIAHRLAMNPYTAKRLLLALQMALDRHERAFGELTVAKAWDVNETKQPGTVAYANLCRVMSTPEELVLDCGLNPQPNAERQRIAASYSFVMLHAVAKRFYGDLQSALDQHEKKHGVLELDVRKRVLPGVR